jgi:hypothetical protein
MLIGTIIKVVRLLIELGSQILITYAKFVNPFGAKGNFWNFYNVF